ncbi:MAG: preprotein translocase subunit SecG [Flammeovirgaceae bacterium]|nr:preprotein translocase subunit SecG [Flammeovirgaceae bacterium]
MVVFITILIVFVAILLVLVVLAQNSKGGGLVGGASSASQTIGTRRTTDWIEKTTWILAITLFVLSLGVNTFIDRVATSTGTSNSPTLEKVYENLPSQNSLVPAEGSNTTSSDSTSNK